jgi:hypothetical protein
MHLRTDRAGAVGQTAERLFSRDRSGPRGAPPRPRRIHAPRGRPCVDAEFLSLA